MAGCSHTHDTMNYIPPSCLVTERYSHRDGNWGMGRPAEYAGASPVVPWFRTGYESVESVLDEVGDGVDSQVVIQELLLTPLA